MQQLNANVYAILGKKFLTDDNSVTCVNWSYKRCSEENGLNVEIFLGAIGVILKLYFIRLVFYVV